MGVEVRVCDWLCYVHTFGFSEVNPADQNSLPDWELIEFSQSPPEFFME